MLTTKARLGLWLIGVTVLVAAGYRILPLLSDSSPQDRSLSLLPESVTGQSPTKSDDSNEGAAGIHPPVGKAAGLFPNDWFHRQRAFPNQDYPASAIYQAIEHARDEWAQRRSDDETPWTSAGPLNIGGRITAIAVHPDEPQRIFAGVATGGIFRSTDDGATWSSVFDNVAPLAIGAIAIDPQHPDRVYVGTGEANASGDSFPGAGVFVSTDAGNTWSSLGLEATRHIGRIAIDPDDANRIYVAAAGALFSTNPERGLYRTTNGGTSWEQHLDLTESTGVIDVLIDPSDADRVFAATWERIRYPDERTMGGVTSGVYRSTDRGESWTLLEGGLPESSATIGRIGLAAAPSAPGTFLATYADDPGFYDGTYRTTDSGDTWNRLNDGAIGGVYSSFGWYFGNVRVSPTDANRIYILGLPLVRSTNGGMNWTDASNGMHVDHHDLWIDPNNPSYMVAGNDGGVYISSNAGTSWTHVQTLPLTQFYAGTIDPSLPERIYGGAQDTGTSRTLTGADDDWDQILGGDGFYCLVDPANSNRLWAEFQYGDLYRSTNGGANWTSATSGIDGADRRNWSTPVVAEPGSSNVLYYGTQRLWRSTNGAGSWSAISSDLTDGTGDTELPFHTITTIAVAPSDDARLYVGTDDAHVWTSSNTGSSWTEITGSLPTRWVTRVAVDPTNPLIAYVTHSGYHEDEAIPHVHRTTNAGTTWTPIIDGLPDAAVNVIEVDPLESSALYLGTDVGVYVSYNSGTLWRPLGTGIPPLVIHDLEVHAGTRDMVAFTHARSSYRIALPVPSDVPAPPIATNQMQLSAFPNPFTEHVTLQLVGPGASEVRIEVYDAGGRRVRDLGATPESPSTEAKKMSGSSSPEVAALIFDGLDTEGHRIPAGVYFARTASPPGAEIRIVRLP